MYVLLLGFCKINFGVLFLGGALACIILIDLFKYKSLNRAAIIKYGSFFISIFLIWTVIYFSLIRGLSFREINQCFPFFKGYMYYGGSLSSNLIIFFKRILVDIEQNHFDTALFIIISLAVFRLLFHMIWNHGFLTKDGRNSLLIILILLILMMVSYHEYIKGATD